MQSILNRLEAGYLVALRVLLGIILGLAGITFVLTLLMYFSTVLVTDEYETADFQRVPDWSDLRYDVLPLKKPEAEPLGTSTTGTTQPTRQTEIYTLYAIQIEAIKSNLQQPFADVEDFVLAEHLNISAIVQFLVEDSGIEESDHERFIDAFVVFTADLAQEPFLTRVFDVEARVDLIVDAIRRFVESYTKEYEKAAHAAGERNAREQVEKSTSQVSLLPVIGVSFGILILMSMMLILARIETHVKEVASRD